MPQLSISNPPFSLTRNVLGSRAEQVAHRYPARSLFPYCLHCCLPALFRALALSLLLSLTATAMPLKLGDLDEDGVPTILDVAKLAAHFRGTHPLTPQVALFADMNQDGALNEADQEALASEILQLSTPRNLPLTTHS